MDGTVSRTTSNVNTWINVNGNGINTGENRPVRDIAINPDDENDVIVTFDWFRDDNVWRTTDGGSSWADISGIAPNELPILPVGAVTFHPDNPSWIYIGTDLGVLASEDGGDSWSRTSAYSTNEGPVNTEVADLFWDGPVLYAATHGRGIWSTTPFVELWVNLSHAGAEEGSFSLPFDTATEGLNAMGNGTGMSIFGGSYQEPNMVFDKRGRIRGYNGTVVIK